eukprot:g76286.t1
MGMARHLARARKVDQIFSLGCRKEQTVCELYCTFARGRLRGCWRDRKLGRSGNLSNSSIDCASAALLY